MQVTYSHEAELKSDLYLYLSNHQWTFHFSICQKLERLFVSSQFVVALNLLFAGARVLCLSVDHLLTILSIIYHCSLGVLLVSMSMVGDLRLNKTETSCDNCTTGVG